MSEEICKVERDRTCENTRHSVRKEIFLKKRERKGKGKGKRQDEFILKKARNPVENRKIRKNHIIINQYHD